MYNQWLSLNDITPKQIDKKRRKLGDLVTLKTPYPYKGMVTISNDCEGMNRIQYEDYIGFFFHKYGLRISHSLFFYARNVNFESSTSIFECDKIISSDASLLRDLIIDGHIDTLHAFGDFDDGSFEPKHLNNTIEWLAANDLCLPLYSNHGSDKNYQNVGRVDFNSYHEGDNPDSKYYVLSSLLNSGTEFFWMDDCLCEEPWQTSSPLKQTTARDGNKIRVFNRYRGLLGKPAPTVTSFSEQINKNDIQKIMDTEACCIYYQHLGVRSRNNPSEKFVSATSLDLNTESISTIEWLADLNRQKKILIDTASQILRYVFARDNIKALYFQDRIWLTTKNNIEHRIYFNGLSFKLNKKRTVNEVIYISNDQFKMLSGWKISYVANGQQVIYFPWRE